MDEPTNHLDLESITALNKGMERFDGNMIFATHDEEIISTVANRIIRIGSTIEYDKNISYEDYLEKITKRDLMKAGLTGNKNSAQLREKIANEFNFNSGNTKTFLKRLNAVNLSEKELKEKIYEILSR